MTQKCRDDGMVGGEVLSKVGAIIIRIGFFGAHPTLFYSITITIVRNLQNNYW